MLQSYTKNLGAANAMLAMKEFKLVLVKALFFV